MQQSQGPIWKQGFTPAVLKEMNDLYCERERSWRINGTSRLSAQRGMTPEQLQLRKQYWHDWDSWAKSQVTKIANLFKKAREEYMRAHGGTAPEGRWDYLAAYDIWLEPSDANGITDELCQFIWEQYGPHIMAKNRQWFFPPAKIIGSKRGDGGAGGAGGSEGSGAAVGAEEGSGAAGGEGGGGSANKRKKPGDLGYPDFFAVAEPAGYGPNGEPPPGGAMGQICDILSALHTKLQSLELRQLDGV